ncbi:MAG: hypothetical protein HY738_19000 [Bacteroidia bacterium]|nr:hypothetical protein [Bacteroidia bacterium]
MKKLSLVFICTMFVISNIFAQGAKAEFEKAQKAGKSIYLIVTDKLATGTDGLLKIVEDAQKTAKKTAVIKLDRDDKANADLISKYRLAGAPLPMVLVLASNGVASGGLTSKDATVEKLLSFLPTKTQAEVLLGFENDKPAFIVCGKKNAKDKTTIEAECKQAITSLGNKATQVFVDVDSKEEINFLALIKPDLTKTTVLVFNGKGQYTGTLESTAKSIRNRNLFQV